MATSKANRSKKSKMSIAVPIVEKHFPKYCEGEIEAGVIIDELVKKAKLTKAGARTYFFNIKQRILEDEMN